MKGRTHTARLLLLTMGLTAAVGCHRPLRSGLNALADGNTERARKHARAGLQKDRSDAKLNLLMADALIAEERWRDALPYAKRAFDDPSLKAEAGRSLGKVYWELDETMDALRAWRTAREADPTAVGDDDYTRALERAIGVANNSADPASELLFRLELLELDPEHEQATAAMIHAARERYAVVLTREGNYENAVEQYGILAQAQPDRAEYPYQQGILLAQLGEDDRAIAAFERFVEASDETKRAQHLREVAQDAEKLGAFVVAVHFYEEAIKAIGPDASRRRARLHRQVGGLLLSTGIKDEGERHLRAYIEDMHAVSTGELPAETYISAATVATSNRHPDLALALLEEATTRAAPSWRASRRLADLYARRAKSEDVERVLRSYVERSSRPTRALVTVGEWATNRRNFDLARFFLEKATAGKKSDLTPNVWLILARVYSALGNLDEVRRCLKTYTAESSDKRRALLDVATIYRTQRMYDEAEDALQAALKREPEDLLVVKLLEDLYREWGRPQKIHDVYTTWAKKRGNKAEDLQLIGDRFFRQQDWENALPYLERAAKAGEHDAWLQVADIFAQQRKERDMKKALDQYLAAAPHRARALADVLQRYRVANWDHESIPILEELITLEPRNLLHYERLSQHYFEQGRDVEAFELWKRYIGLSDNPTAALATMARRFRRAQHQEWMLAFLRQILEREEKPDPQIYRLLGDTYSDLARVQRKPLKWNGIHTAERRAAVWYAKYLAEGNPTRGELQTFAESMAKKRQWTIAADAYARLVKEGELKSHQMLSYGTVLLNLGQPEQAEALFAELYADRSQSVDIAVQISDELHKHHRYDSAIPYLRAMLQNGEEGAVRAAFLKLAEIYRESDQSDKMPGLIADFLDRSQDPQEARREVQRTLEAHGMWEEAARQLETVAELHEEASFELGQNLYRAGKHDAADDAFRDFTAENLNPSEAWMRVAIFYESRGELEKARNAFQNAANAAPQDATALAQLGRFLIMTGRADEGRAAFERARNNVAHGSRGNLYRAEVEALQYAGEFASAREAARDAITVAYLDREFFYRVIAPIDLNSGDPVRSRRMVDEISGANLPLETSVTLLRESGYLEEAVALVEKEIAAGDHILGGDVLLKHADLFTALGGVSRLMRSAQPLLERGGRDARFPRTLGTFLINAGDLARGSRLLRQAYDLGETDLASDIAAAYAELGHHDEALQIMQSHLAGLNSSIVRGAVLNQVGRRYEYLGERTRFRALLEQLGRDVRFASEAVPLLLRYLVEDGEVARAVEMVSRTMSNPATPSAQSEDVPEDIRVIALVSGVQELVIAGFEQEAEGLLQAAPAEVSDKDEVRELRLRIAIVSSPQSADSKLGDALAELGSDPEGQDKQLRIGHLALVAGRYDFARRVAHGVLDSADQGVRSRAMRLGLASARAANDLDDVDATVAKYLEGSPDRVGARTTASRALQSLGLDDRALALAKTQAEKVPTFPNVHAALELAEQAGDAKALNGWALRMREVHSNDGDGRLRSLYARWVLGLRAHEAAPLRKAIAPMFEPTYIGFETDYREHYFRGRPEAARELILQRLHDASFEPSTVQDIFEELQRAHLYGEIAKVVAPKVPQDNLTMPARRIIGLANLTMGFDAEGIRQLDQTIEAAPDPAHEASIIANTLLYRERPETALRFAEMAVEKRPNRPAARRARGLARLALGDAAGAEEDLSIALDAGIFRHSTLLTAANYALRGGHDAIAHAYFDKLLEEVSFGPGWVAQTFVENDRAKEGVVFLEKRRPDIVAGRGLAGAGSAPGFSALFEAAQLDDQAFELYERARRRLAVEDPHDDQLATYNNNLAYMYSTTNRNIDAGFDLVLRAIAQVPERQASFIDTVGWLHYRAGDLEAAEAEVRRAIRTYSSRGDDAQAELFEHLAELRAARGYHGESVWLNMHAEALEP